MVENFVTISKYAGRYVNGVGVTLYMTLLCVTGGFVLSIPLAFMKISKNKILRAIGFVYTDIFRSIPALVILYLSYFAIPTVLNITISAPVAAFITLSMVSAAYVSESLRGGVEAIDVGQKEAAKALGVPYKRTMFDIILPQSLRAILPALVNETIGNLKSTSLISIIGVTDLMRVSRQVMADTYIMFEPLIVAAIAYYVLVKLLSGLSQTLEEKLGRSARKIQ